MVDLLALPTGVYIALGVVALFIWLWRASVPRPIPGNIPYDAVSAKRAFGDIWDAIKADDPLSFFLGKANQIKSPIFQVFIAPFGPPTVCITDSREAHDILARRTREFDRAEFFANLFVTVAPNNQVCMPTNDQWHANRRLMADTMSPTFLNNSAAPQAAAVFSTFIDLWQARAKLGQNIPFEAAQDIDYALLDTITAIAFGSSSHSTEAEREFVNSSDCKVWDTTIDGDRIVEFDRTIPPTEHAAIEALAHSTALPADSPFGVWAHRFAMTFWPSLRKAQAVRKQVVTRQIHIAFEKFSNPEAGGDDIRSATDLIVQREIALAKKEGRLPQLTSPVLDDELFGFLVAGYDTTATTVKWAVKYLTHYPRVQTKLREELHAAYADTLANGGRPTIEDASKRRPAYLDAFIEEVLRLGNPGVGAMRTTTMDVEIFGHYVPKGTDVLLMNVGPDQTQPPLYVDEQSRSKTSQETINTAYTGNWDPQTLGEFIPERWLNKLSNGQTEFNPRAGAQQTFGGGLRGCFGRKLAYVMMRILFSMMVWEFEFMPLDEGLDSFVNKVVLTNQPVKCYVKLRSLRKE